MKATRRAVLSLPALAAPALLAGPAAAAQPAQTASWPRSDDLDAACRLALRSAQLAGLSIAVRKDGSLVHAAGYGHANIELAAPATPETVYRIGSITKQFTAVLALLMAEQGRLDLDAAIGRYLPELQHAKDPTIRQLLSHTAGLASFDPDVMPDAFHDRASDLSKARMLAFIDGAPRDFPAGEKFSYSNSGCLLVGLALERITGVGYEQLIARDVLEPAGLKRTRYDVTSEMVPGRAAGYVSRSGDISNAAWNSPSRPYASGALLSSALDLIAWHTRLYEGDLLRPAALRDMTTPARLSTGAEVPYGLGVRILTGFGRRRIAHGGLIVGFTGLLARYPSDRLDIAILTNTQEQAKTLMDLEVRVASTFLAARTPLAQINEGSDQPRTIV
jgi:D-alanyl-D-alanine carboxypeptidase